MLQPNASSLDLMLAAPTDPIVVLMVCQSRLIEARDLARIDFDEYAAAEIVQETAVILGAVAKGLREHATSPPFARPGKKQVNAAVKAFAEQDAGSPAWQDL